MYRLIKKNCFVKIQKIRREKGKFYAPRIFLEIFTDYKHIHNLHLKSLLYLTQMLIGSSIFPIRNTLVTRSKRTPPPVIIATHSNLVKRSSNIITTCPVQACVRAYTVLPLSSLVPPPSPPKESPKDTGLKPENVGRQLAGAQLNSVDSRGLEAIPSPLLCKLLPTPFQRLYLSPHQPDIPAVSRHSFRMAGPDRESRDPPRC